MNMGFREGRYYGALEKTGIKIMEKSLTASGVLLFKKK